jgi:CRP-like cAMP-binding protein
MLIKETLTNKILTGLTDDAFARLMPLLEPVALAGGKLLSEAGEKLRFVYFPEDSVIASIAEMENGKSAEAGMVGRDGVADLTSLLGSRHAPHSLHVSVAGTALKMRTEDLERELLRNDGIQQSLFSYACEYVAQISQRSACAVLHLLEQRLAVWLLLVADRLDTDVIQITQERIGQHLGVRRASVNSVAAALQATGAISYRRGILRITNREALEATACECYVALS